MSNFKIQREALASLVPLPMPMVLPKCTILLIHKALMEIFDD